MSETQKMPQRWIMPTEFGSPFGDLAERRVQFEGQIKGATYAGTSRTMTVNFLTDAGKLEKMLPEGKGLTLRGDPVVSVMAIYQGPLDWLAGRSYDIVTVTFPVTFKGKERQVDGAFAPVIWENMTEPILAGRETLGWSKIYADIEPPVLFGNGIHCTAGWYGFKFMDLKIDKLRELSQEELRAMQKASQPGEGSIHWKYVPKTGSPGEADADYLTISTNRGAPPTTVKTFSSWSGDGSITFHKARWEDAPMTANVINAFADLEVKEVVSSLVIKTESLGGGMGQTIILE